MRYLKSLPVLLGGTTAAIVALALVNASHQSGPSIGRDGVTNAEEVMERCEAAYKTGDDQLHCYKDAMAQDDDGKP